ncbi:MAG: sugar transferase [Bacteroidetes bacterium]|nr:sugar transferase [Bacteroidota bacterium]
MNKGIIIAEQGEKAYSYISNFLNIENNDIEVVKTTTKFNILKISDQKMGIVNLNKINDINKINEFFKVVNQKLNDNGIFIGCVETKIERRKRLYKKYPVVFAQIYYFFDFVFKRVFSKLWMTKWLYFFVTAGRNQVLSRAEALGRLAYCGFEIIDECEIDNINYFVVKKVKMVDCVKEPRFSILFKMNRIGKNGKTITVYKIRTMHPYAEYLQEYIYKISNLQKGGKFNNDFRITSWGRILRKLWIDELPMLVNLFKGQLKLVGVRPLSNQYLSLYSEELKAKRKEVKPGLIPPFYADLPNTLEEIMKSEISYIDAYKNHPFNTDLKYFFKATTNILFNSARSN